jgi:mono/diheme cytochrome c family protein
VDRNDIIIGLAALVLVVFSLLVALVIPRRNPNFPGRRMGAFVVVAALLVVAVLASVEALGESHDFSHESAAEAAEPAAPEGGGAPEAPPAEGATTGVPPAATGESGGGEAAPAGDPAAGKEVFASAGCVSCHTLADAGATGAVGPNLDEAKPPYERVVDRVTNGKGVMPPFAGQLSEEQIADVAAYVTQATSG